MNIPVTAFDRYLGILGVRRSEPTWEALSQLTSAHLVRIPFENVSKIHRARVRGYRNIPPLEEFLEGVERHHFGGTCFVNNYYFHLLLVDLGYQVKLCGADIAVNGAPPNGHMLNVVSVDGKEAIVDVGYGAPFWQPIPRDSTADETLQLGSERYVLKPQDEQGRSKLEVYREGQLRHGYLLKPAARCVDDFDEVVTRSYSDSAPFLNALVLARFFENRSVVLRNFTVTEFYDSQSHTETLGTKDEVKEAVAEYFEMPARIVDEAMNSIGELKDFGS